MFILDSDTVIGKTYYLSKWGNCGSLAVMLNQTVNDGVAHSKIYTII